MIVLYARLTEADIRAQIPEGIRKANEFLAKHPDRQECVAGMWYRRQVTVRRGHVEEDINAAAEDAIRKCYELLKREPSEPE